MVVCKRLQAAEGEKNSKAARRIVKLLDKLDLDSLLDVGGDFSQVAQLYHDCARVCLEGERTFYQIGGLRSFIARPVELLLLAASL